MKIHFTLFLIPLLFGSFTTLGQNRTYLGIETSPKFDVYRAADPGGIVYTRPFFWAPIYGVTIGQELSDRVIVETGCYRNDYGDSYRLRGNWGYSMSNAFVAYQFPIRLKTYFNLVKDHVKIGSTIGYTLALNTEWDSGGGGGSGFDNGDLKISATETATYGSGPLHGLLETGLTIEQKFNDSWTLVFGANYLMGLNKVVEVDVTYSVNDGPDQKAFVTSGGDYFSFIFGIKYPISKIWNKKSDAGKV